MAFPEFREARRKAPKKDTQPATGLSLRKIAGIVALIAGLFMMLGLLLGGFYYITLASLFISNARSPPSAFYVFVTTLIFGGLLGILLAVFSLIAGVRSLRGNPARTARIASILWGAMLFIIFILGLVFDVIKEEGTPLKVSKAMMIAGILGAIMIIIGAALVRGGASFLGYMAGVSLLLVGTILVLIGANLGDSLNDLISFGSKEYKGYLSTITFTNIVMIMGMIVGIIGLMIAPFLGRKFVWLITTIGLIGILVSSIGGTYYVATTIGDFSDLWDAASRGSGLQKAVAIFGLSSSIILTIGMVVVIVASIFGIILQVLHGLRGVSRLQSSAM